MSLDSFGLFHHPVVGGILFDTLFDEAGFLTLACVKGFLHGVGTQFLHRGDVAATFIRPTPDHAAALVCVNHAVNPGAFNAGHNSVQKTGDGDELHGLR